MKQHLQIKNSMRLLFWSVAFLLLLVPGKGFGQLLTEDFSYTTPGDITTASGGNWTAHSGTTFYPQYTNSGLTYAGYAGSNVGGAVTISSTGVADVNRTFTNQTSGSVYAAFMVNVNAASLTADYFAHFGLTATGSTFSGRLFVKRDASNNLAFGLTKAAAVASATFTPFSYSLNTTYLVVLKYSILSGATNDTVVMYINPVLNGTEPGSTTVTAADPTAADLTAGVGSFAIRQGTPPGLTLDGLRVGTTWASILPASASITGAATTTAFTTTYGASSASQSFTISGSSLTANLIATAPTGFEVSSDGTTYGATASFTQSSGSASGTLRIRLKAAATVSGSYNSQNIVLSSTGATAVNITTPASGNAVSRAVLTITASNQSVSFGDAAATVLAAGAYTSSGFVNGESATVISGSASYTTNYTNTTAAGTSGVTITPVVTSLIASNYTFTPINGTITIASNPIPSITSALTFSTAYGTVASIYTITASNSPNSYSTSALPTGLSLNSSTGEITGTPTDAPGTYNITISATNAGGPGSGQTLVYTITAKPLTVTGASADNKPYDKTLTATISGSTLVGIYNTDVVTISSTGTFATSSVANGIAVTSTQTLGGADAAKYSLTVPTSLTANITAKALTISSAAAQNKPFDGTTTATITGTLNGVVSPDVVALTLSGTFASSAIASGIAVTSTSTISGANSGNYTLTQPTGLTANITVAVVPLLQWNTFGNAGTETTQATAAFNTNMTASSLNYTGSTVVPASNGNRFGGTWGTVATPTANKYIQFTASPAVGYMFSPTSFSFIWDFSGTGPSSVSLRSSVDNYATDLGTVTGMTTSTTVFKTINISGLTGLSGATTFRLYGYGATGGTGGFDCASSQNNVVLNGYTELAPPPAIATTGTLSSLTTVYGTASNTTTFNVSGTYMEAGVLVTPPAGYEVSLTSTSGFASTVTVGAAGTISTTPVYVRLKANATVISSPYAGNIVLSSTNTTSVNVATVSSNVTTKTLTVTGLIASNKVYDGNASAVLSGIGTLVGVINSDVVSLDGTPVGTFTSTAIGTGITINVSGYSISGAGSGNYSLTAPTLLADITSVASPVISSALTASATYGVASTTYTITASDSPTSYNATGLPAGLLINTSTGEITGISTALPNTYNVTISAINAGGTGSATLVYTILAKELTVTGASVTNKIYNKLPAATITGSTLVGIVGSDVVTVTNTGTFASVNVANGIAVTSTQTLSGADAGKYTLTVPTGLTANITPKALTISGAVAQSKQIDGNTNAVITGTLVVIESGDVVTLNGTGTFASSAVANGISVTSTSTINGSSAGNYTLTQPTGLTANITPPTLLQWNTFGNAGTETTEPSTSNNANIASSNLNYTGSTVATTSTNSNRLGGTSWGIGALATAKYIQFTVTPNTLYSFTPTSFSFLWDFSGTGPSSVSLRSSADNYAADLGSLTGMTASTSTFKTINITGLTNISSTTTFRLYGYAATAIGGTGGFDCATSQNNVILYGTTAPLTGSTASVISGTNSICDGDSATISVAITGGTSPYTVVYNDGTSDVTVNNYVSGSNILVSPTVNTNYTLVSVTDSNSLVGTGNSGSANITLLPNLTYYQDADGDGYGDSSVSILTCVVIPGYVLNSTDCDDTNGLIYRSALLYTDADADGYDAGSAVTCYGVTLPTGTSLTTLGTDCNDTNATMHTTYAFYADADHDTYGAGSLVNVCAANASTPPTNYSVNSTDCDDTKLTTHPGAVDVCYDGIDNDCNGNIDNVGLPGGCVPIVSTIVPTQCGITLPLIDDSVVGVLVSNAQGYRWRITKMIAGVPSTNPADIQSIDTGLRVFKFTQLATYAFDTNYKVEISVRLGGVWQPYFGTACTVRTPATTTKVLDSQCGTRLTLMTDVVYAGLVPYATGYRFRVTNLLTSTVSTPIDRSLREFRFNLLSGITYNTPYKIEVAIRNTDGTFLPYGQSCNINTPTFPTTQFQTSQCDYTAVSSSEVLYADAVSGASAYRFSFENGSATIITPPNYVRSVALNSIVGLVSGVYSVKVAVQIGGVWGPYGKTCTLTIPGVAKVIESTVTTIEQPATFEATAYPNPFADNFKLEVKTNSEDNLQVRVYDMLGKQIEDRLVKSSDIQSFEVGASYPSGVYNVIVTQGDNTKTLRVIKR